MQQPGKCTAVYRYKASVEPFAWRREEAGAPRCAGAAVCDRHHQLVNVVHLGGALRTQQTAFRSSCTCDWGVGRTRPQINIAPAVLPAERLCSCVADRAIQTPVCGSRARTLRRRTQILLSDPVPICDLVIPERAPWLGLQDRPIFKTQTSVKLLTAARWRLASVLKESRAGISLCTLLRHGMPILASAASLLPLANAMLMHKHSVSRLPRALAEVCWPLGCRP